MKTKQLYMGNSGLKNRMRNRASVKIFKLRIKYLKEAMTDIIGCKGGSPADLYDLSFLDKHI